MSWPTKEKMLHANYFGSLTQASTVRVGSYNGEEIYAPFKSLLPMVKLYSFLSSNCLFLTVSKYAFDSFFLFLFTYSLFLPLCMREIFLFKVNPNDVVFGGWDINGMNLADAMDRAKVLDYELQRQLKPIMESMVPLPGIYDPDFIAANQGSRADNVIKGTKKEQLRQIINDIRYTIFQLTILLAREM